MSVLKCVIYNSRKEVWACAVGGRGLERAGGVGAVDDRRAAVCRRARPLAVPCPAPVLSQPQRPSLHHTPAGAAAPAAASAEVVFVPSTLTSGRYTRPCSPRSLAARAVDVIDLGAPRCLRRAAALPRRPPLYTPNPRLYPGPAAKQKRKRKRSERYRPVFQRPLPNARLYRPAPPAPRRLWPSPAPPAPAHALDTASRAALRLAACRPAPARAPATRRPAPAPAPAPAPRDRRLVVTLPPGAAAAMEAPPSPEGSESASAPSEFLAEFLSAIMRRQYAEALKYCRLILQYEPHNTTARGFYPLLQHKLQTHHDNDTAGGGARRASLSDSSGAAPSRSSSRSHSRSHSHSDDNFRNVRVSPDASSWEGSGASQSSLELDSSSGEREPPPDPRHPSPADPRDPRDPPPTDGNGNHTLAPPCPDDLENDNDVSSFQSAASAAAAAAGPAHASLRRLRAHFACSIK